MDVNNLLDAFFNYFLWLMIHLCKPHVVKFIISLILAIQILVYYLLEVSLIAFISTSFEFFFFLVKFVIALAFFPKKKKAYYKIKGIDFFIKKLWY